MWRATLRFSAVGLEMGVAVAIGYGLGWWLDGRFSTRPYLTVAMLLLGIAAAFRSLYRAAKEGQRVADGRDEDEKENE
jgi:ATP synthase protein I